MGEKKTLTVVQLLPELDGGGVERGTLELGKYLVDTGHRSIVVSGGGRLQSQLEEEGSEHVAMTTGNKSLTSLRFIGPLRKLMLEEQVDIFHMRSRMPAWIGYLAWKSLPPDKRPALITTFHGFYSVNKYSAVMTKGDAVIAVSESVKDHIFANYGRKENVVVIHRGVDSGFAPEMIGSDRLETLKKRWNLRPGVPVVMLPARFTRWKGHHLFLDALNELAETPFEAILVGDPAEKPQYRDEIVTKINAYGLHDRVHLVGHCRDMAAAYLLSDIVVSASSGQAEAFGRVTIEAMAMGKPVIATAHGGSLETVDDGVTGWLVTPGNVSDMAKAMQYGLSLSAEQRVAIGRKGREHVQAQFTTEKMCRSTVELYWDILARGRRKIC